MNRLDTASVTYTRWTKQTSNFWYNIIHFDAFISSGDIFCRHLCGNKAGTNYFHSFVFFPRSYFEEPVLCPHARTAYCYVEYIQCGQGNKKRKKKKTLPNTATRRLSTLISVFPSSHFSSLLPLPSLPSLCCFLWCRSPPVRRPPLDLPAPRRSDPNSPHSCCRGPHSATLLTAGVNVQASCFALHPETFSPIHHGRRKTCRSRYLVRWSLTLLERLFWDNSFSRRHLLAANQGLDESHSVFVL